MAVITAGVVLTTSGWCWYMWPVWTMNEFIEHCNNNDYESAGALMRDSKMLLNVPRVEPSFTIDERSPLDIVQGKARFSMSEPVYATLGAERGHVTMHLRMSVYSGVEYLP